MDKEGGVGSIINFNGYRYPEICFNSVPLINSVSPFVEVKITSESSNLTEKIFSCCQAILLGNVLGFL